MTGGVGGNDGFGAGGSSLIDSGVPDARPPATCPVKSFSGTMTGANYNTVLGKLAFKATIAFTVDERGTITGTYTSTSPRSAMAQLSGTMTCATSAVTIALQGSYPGTLFPPIAGGTYTGTLTGAYSATSASFSGPWTIKENNAAYGGDGTWSAM